MTRDDLISDLLTAIVVIPALIVGGFLYVVLAWNVLHLIGKVYP